MVPLIARLILPTTWIAQHSWAADSLKPLTNGRAPRSVIELWEKSDPRAEPLNVEIVRDWTDNGGTVRVRQWLPPGRPMGLAGISSPRLRRSQVLSKGQLALLALRHAQVSRPTRGRTAWRPICLRGDDKLCWAEDEFIVRPKPYPEAAEAAPSKNGPVDSEFQKAIERSLKQWLANVDPP